MFFSEHYEDKIFTNGILFVKFMKIFPLKNNLDATVYVVYHDGIDLNHGYMGCCFGTLNHRILIIKLIM